MIGIAAALRVIGLAACAPLGALSPNLFCRHEHTGRVARGQTGALIGQRCAHATISKEAP